MNIPGQLSSLPLDTEVVQVLLAAALGLFLGLEREWSHKSAGIRTFSLVALLGAVFTVVGAEALVVVGGLLVIVQGVLVAVDRMRDEDKEGLSLTTSVSMLVAYGVGVLVATEFVLEAVTVTVTSSLLLVLKRELHSFAWGLSRAELRSAAEFAILAFVVYPLLPAGEFELGVRELTVTVEPRVIWLLVVTVAGIGIVNYAIVQNYGGRGIAVTGFFGGLASSTAVVGTMIDHVRQHPEARSYAVAAILLADAAMAVRNLAIAVAFTFESGVLVGAVVPLGAVILGSVVIAALTADWDETVPMDLDSPFSLRYVLGFGGLFLLVVVAGGLAAGQFGTVGFYVTAALTGLVSSAGATTSAVILYRGGGLSAEATVVAILLATAASIVVKAGLTVASPDRTFARRVAVYSTVLLVAAGAVTAAGTV
ncbi:MgtC/SapB transporter [Halobacteriales archaeon QH_10_67_22]|nr:MAG: MgtC/SapB transporter [Halobacteriales archaeon QH_10_67_22]